MSLFIVGVTLFAVGIMWELRMMRRRLAAVEQIVCAATDTGICPNCRRYFSTR